MVGTDGDRPSVGELEVLMDALVVLNSQGSPGTGDESGRRSQAGGLFPSEDGSQGASGV